MSAADKTKLDGIAASANNYSLPLATSSVRGGVKIGYTATGKNYPVQLSNEQMYVNVPWTDTDTNTVTSVGISGDLSTGNVEFRGAGATTITKSGGTITITSTDTNTDTTYSAGTNLSLSGTTFNVSSTPSFTRVAATEQVSVKNRTAISVAHWSSTSATGAVVITLPGSHTGNWSMLVLRITAYEYSSNSHCVYYVSGHDWTSGWYNNGITKIGVGKNVRLGYNNSTNKDYVVLGETNSSWSYGHVTVDVMAHPSFYTSSMDITEGWDIRLTTDLGGYSFADVANRQVLDSSNYTSYAPSLTGTGASGNWGINITGNSATATSFSTNRTNYKSVTDSSVVGQMMWKNYGNNHTIFDASNSTSPGGTAISNTNPEVPWTGTYPTLMGWNGSSTYGVRVDSARYADSASSVTWDNVSGKPSTFSPSAHTHDDRYYTETEFRF